MDKFFEAPSIEWHYFFLITINTTVPLTPSLLFLFCRFIGVIVIVAVAFIVVITAVDAASFLVIIIVCSCLIGRICLQLTKCIVVDISILINLALALIIGLNTKNLATEK